MTASCKSLSQETRSTARPDEDSPLPAPRLPNGELPDGVLPAIEQPPSAQPPLEPPALPARVEARLLQADNARGIAQELGLHVVPVEQVLPHERFNGERVANLMRRIEQEDRLINPPVAVAYDERYIVLDGATRVTAFRRLGYPHIIIQVVDLVRNRIRLDTWQHTVHGGQTADLLAQLDTIPGLILRPVEPARLLGKTPVQPGLGFLLTPDNRGFVLEAHPSIQPVAPADSADPADPARHGDAFASHGFAQPEEAPADWLSLFNRVVDTCGEWGRVERTLSTDMEALRARYPDLAGHFIFHGFEAQEVLDLAARGRTVPAGITRFVIPGRVLRLNAPLHDLLTPEPLEAKQSRLDALLTQKIDRRQMRYYEEPVVLLDE